jgi:hypothetical protein
MPTAHIRTEYQSRTHPHRMPKPHTSTKCQTHRHTHNQTYPQCHARGNGISQQGTVLPNKHCYVIFTRTRPLLLCEFGLVSLVGLQETTDLVCDLRVIINWRQRGESKSDLHDVVYLLGCEGLEDCFDIIARNDSQIKHTCHVKIGLFGSCGVVKLEQPRNARCHKPIITWVRS